MLQYPYGSPSVKTRTGSFLSSASLRTKRRQARVAEALERRGVPIEARAWQAHVTIGRITDDNRGRGEGMPELRSAVMRGATVPFSSMPVASIALMRSDLYASGARYTGIASVPLASESGV
jgi:2'-5' RNA ligase